MRKMLNKVTIIGKVYAFGDARGKDVLSMKKTGPTAKTPNTDFFGGTIQIAVDPECTNIIPVHFSYVAAKFSKDKENKSFGVLANIVNTQKCVVNNGFEEAPLVEIDASVDLNDFYQNPEDASTLVSSKRVEGSFIKTRAMFPVDPAECNAFRTDMLIKTVTRVEATENQPEHGLLKGFVFAYGGRILPVDFRINDMKGVDYFESLVDDGASLTTVWGNLFFNTQIVEKTEESAWGAPKVTKYENRKRDWLIGGSAATPFDLSNPEILTVEEIEEALAKREVYLAEERQRALDWKQNKNTVAAPANTAPAAPVANDKPWKF